MMSNERLYQIEKELERIGDVLWSMLEGEQRELYRELRYAKTGTRPAEEANDGQAD